jgi:hypothetical protein
MGLRNKPLGCREAALVASIFQYMKIINEVNHLKWPCGIITAKKTGVV